MKDDDLTGRKVGEYEILTRIGAGGMGVVYEGVQPVIGKRVAVKVLLPQLSSDAELVERFLSEARAVNAIRHRGIVDIFSFGETPTGAHYFVMEFLDGEAFDRIIKDRAPVSPYEVLTWTEEVLDALDAAHSSGIIHRDIKPSNLFLVNPGRGRSYVKLLDFGIAKLGALKGEATPQTRASVIIGTPDYMSPEQARGRDISPSTDLYALACVMFELFTGKRMFKGENAMQTMFMHVENTPPRVSEFVPNIPPELDDLLLWTLEKDASQRPASAAEMRSHVESLKKLVPNEQTQAFTPPPRSYSAPGAGPATPGPGSARSRRMGTPAPRSMRAKPIDTLADAEIQPPADSTRIVAAPTREFNELEEQEERTPPPHATLDQEQQTDAAKPALAPSSSSRIWLFVGLAAFGAIGTIGFLSFRPDPVQQPLVVVPPPPPKPKDTTLEDKAAADKAAADKQAAADKLAADKKDAADAAKAAADQTAADKKAAAEAKKAAADEAAAQKKAATEEAAAKKAAADLEKKALADKKDTKVASATPTKKGKVYSAADLDARLAALTKRLEAKETKSGKDRVLRQFLDQGKADAAKAQSDDDRREVWKFLTDFEKQLGP